MFGMNKTCRRSPFRIFLGIFGLIVAVVFIISVSILVRCSALSDNQQHLFIGILLLESIILISIYTSIRQKRHTHHDYWNRHGKFQQDIGPIEQKCGQFTIIFVITAVIIYADMWLNWLSRIVSKILSI